MFRNLTLSQLGAQEQTSLQADSNQMGSSTLVQQQTHVESTHQKSKSDLE